MSAITSALTAVGLGTYSGRFIFASVAGFGLQFALKPSLSYTREGKMKPFALLSKDKDSTWMPWWSWSLLPGLFAVLFI